MNQADMPVQNDEVQTVPPPNGAGTVEDPLRIYVGVPERPVNDNDLRHWAMRFAIDAHTWAFRAHGTDDYSVESLIGDARTIEEYLRG